MFRHSILAATLAIGLAGCAGGTLSANSPAPLAQTVIDEKALSVAYIAYDAFLTLTDVQVDAGKLKGAKATERKAVLERIYGALRAASAARRAGSVSDYNNAVAEAFAALELARAAIRS